MHVVRKLADEHPTCVDCSSTCIKLSWLKQATWLPHCTDSFSFFIHTIGALTIRSWYLSVYVLSTFKVTSLKWVGIFLEIIFEPKMKRLLPYLHRSSSRTLLNTSESRSSDFRVFGVNSLAKSQTVNLPHADLELRYCMNQALKLQAVHSTIKYKKYASKV